MRIKRSSSWSENAALNHDLKNISYRKFEMVRTSLLTVICSTTIESIKVYQRAHLSSYLAVTKGAFAFAKNHLSPKRQSG